MLISHRHRFIFFHVAKTGGKSITHALLPYAHLAVRFENPLSRWVLRRVVEANREALARSGTGRESSDAAVRAVSKGIDRAAWLERRLNPRVHGSAFYAMGLKYQLREASSAFLESYDRTADYPDARSLSLVHSHAGPGYCRHHMPREVFDNYFKFAFVREPFDWFESWYYFLNKIWGSGMSDQKMSRAEPIAFELLALREATLDEFIETICTQPSVLTIINSSQGDPVLGSLCDGEGNLLVDFVGKQERLEEDFAVVCDRVGISVELPRLNVGAAREKRPVREDLRRKVKETFPEVYAALDYA